MRKPYISITAEGFHSIFLATLCSIVFALMGCIPLALLGLLATAFACHFFRDPERVTPQEKLLAVSPADGKIVRICRAPNPVTGTEMQCVSIFMNVFSVHVNRMPISGVIKKIIYKPGKFLNANLHKASTDNERCIYKLEDEDGKEWYMVQIAGLIARRIICRVDEGDSLKAGERYGMIRFGSRVDVYLPDNYTPLVMIGDKVMAGSTLLATADAEILARSLREPTPAPVKKCLTKKCAAKCTTAATTESKTEPKPEPTTVDSPEAAQEAEGNSKEQDTPAKEAPLKD